MTLKRLLPLTAIPLLLLGCGPGADDAAEASGGPAAISSSQTGTNGGYYYSFWTNNQGSANMTLDGSNGYSVQWSNIGDFTCGKGWSTGSGHTVPAPPHTAVAFGHTASSLTQASASVRVCSTHTPFSHDRASHVCYQELQETVGFKEVFGDAGPGGLAGVFHKHALHDPVVFLPEFAEPDLLPDLEQGGVATQAGADAELASFLLFLKKRNGRLHSLIFDDPWSKPGDMDYAGPPPEEMLAVEGRVNYLYDLSVLTPDLIWNYRAVAVSFLKIVYVSELTEQAIRDLVEEEPADLFERLAHSVRHIAVNAYDDESWVIVNHEHHDCEKGCGGDCENGCDCEH